MNMYRPEYGWCCGWPDAKPRPFLIEHTVRARREESQQAFLDMWALGTERTWRQAYRQGARCIRVQISPAFQDQTS